MSAKPPLAVYYSTYSTQRRKRVHIVVPPEFGPKARSDGRGQANRAFCSTAAWGDKTVVPPPYVLPAGTAWCPACTGRAAEVLGVLDLAVGPVLAALDDAAAWPSGKP